MLVRTPAAEIREVGRNTQGVRVVRLKDGDQVVGIASAPMEEGEIAEPSGETGTAPEAGDASGQLEAGQAEAGQAEAGQPEAGQAEAGQP